MDIGSPYDGMTLDGLWATLEDCILVKFDPHTGYADYLAHMTRQEVLRQAIARRIIKDWEANR